jgi:phosphoribosylanthranilate isomerase
MAGFVLVPESPRAADAVLPVPDGMLSVAVWVGAAGESDAKLDQVHTVEDGKVRGREAAVLRQGHEVARLLDQPWEGEDPGHWRNAAAASGRIVLAGGLGPDNVRDAVAAVRPWAVDASSSLESSPGIKDHDKIRRYVEAARG